ncbi:MAG TPA: hypothetical protein VKZ53_19040 [Candidatus Angelobacter sp.]|nr:hypothetical protein [Candidatus Angelobacter sp.]
MSVSGHGLFLKKVPEERTKNIKVWFVACISAAVHGCLGVLFAPLFSIAFLAAGLSESFLPGNGMLLAIAFPLGYAAIGFVVGAGAAHFYNLMARHLYHHDGTEQEALERAA